jgi:hypothetical protein
MVINLTVLAVFEVSLVLRRGDLNDPGEVGIGAVLSTRGQIIATTRSDREALPGFGSPIRGALLGMGLDHTDGFIFILNGTDQHHAGPALGPGVMARRPIEELASSGGLLSAIRVAESNLSLEHLSPVADRAAIVGEPLEIGLS